VHVRLLRASLLLPLLRMPRRRHVSRPCLMQLILHIGSAVGGVPMQRKESPIVPFPRYGSRSMLAPT
jgi:hypothetical protein